MLTRSVSTKRHVFISDRSVGNAIAARIVARQQSSIRAQYGMPPKKMYKKKAERCARLFIFKDLLNEFYLGPTVLSPTFFGIVRGDRFIIGFPLYGDALRIYAFGDQLGFNPFSSPLAIHIVYS